MPTDAFRERNVQALDEAVLSLERIQQLVQSHAHHPVWLFGSYASGMADAQSDIDLIVEDDPQLASILSAPDSVCMAMPSARPTQPRWWLPTTLRNRSENVAQIGYWRRP